MTSAVIGQDEGVGGQAHGGRDRDGLLDCRGLGVPELVRQLLAPGEPEPAGDDALRRCLTSDWSLAAPLLQWCNSPLISGPAGLLVRPGPFDDLGDALEAIGRDEGARLAFLVFIRRMFLPDRQVDRYRRSVLWRHNLAVGAVAAMIARICGGLSPGDLFFAGALHDIGLLASERLHGATFRRLVADVDELSAIHEIEQERLGWDHAELGAKILQHWGAPAAAVAATQHHHAPERAIEERDAEAKSVACVALANHLCSRTGWSSLGVHNLMAPDGKVLQQLGIDAHGLTHIWQGLPQTMRDVSAFP